VIVVTLVLLFFGSGAYTNLAEMIDAYNTVSKINRDIHNGEGIQHCRWDNYLTCINESTAKRSINTKDTTYTNAER